MAIIYKFCELRARQIKLAKLKSFFGELFDLVAIPPTGMHLEEVNYILPLSYLRKIDELTVKEMDDLLDNQLKFFIIK